MPTMNDLEQAPPRDEDNQNLKDSDEAADDTTGTIEGVPLCQSAKSKADEKLVKGARVTVMAVLVLSATIVANLAYFLLSKNEQDSFQSQVCIQTQRIHVKTGGLPDLTLFSSLDRSSTVLRVKLSSCPSGTR
jgi:hypothetical protein